MLRTGIPMSVLEREEPQVLATLLDLVVGDSGAENDEEEE